MTVESCHTAAKVIIDSVKKDGWESNLNQFLSLFTSGHKVEARNLAKTMLKSLEIATDTYFTNLLTYEIPEEAETVKGWIVYYLLHGL